MVGILDTHRAMQVFHPVYLIDENGQHPSPLTLVSHDDVLVGRWRFNPGIAPSLGISSQAGQQQLVHYTSQLKKSGKYDLTVWPYHAMQGGIGHSLVPALEEAIFFHTIARSTQAAFILKGEYTSPESYSAIGPEVLSGPAGEAIAIKDDSFLRTVIEHDQVFIAGEAKSHCVAATIADLLEQIPVRLGRGAPARVSVARRPPRGSAPRSAVARVRHARLGAARAVRAVPDQHGRRAGRRDFEHHAAGPAAARLRRRTGRPRAGPGRADASPAGRPACLGAATVLVNATIMTVYLWHLTVLSLLVGLANLLGGVGLHAEPGTAEWWLARVPWLAALTTGLVLLLPLVGRFERSPPLPQDFRPSTWRVLTGAVLASAGIAFLALTSPADSTPPT